MGRRAIFVSFGFGGFFFDGYWSTLILVDRLFTGGIADCFHLRRLISWCLLLSLLLVFCGFPLPLSPKCRDSAWDGFELALFAGPI